MTAGSYSARHTEDMAICSTEMSDGVPSDYETSNDRDLSRKTTARDTTATPTMASASHAILSRRSGGRSTTQKAAIPTTTHHQPRTRVRQATIEIAGQASWTQTGRSRCRSGRKPRRTVTVNGQTAARDASSRPCGLIMPAE